MTLPNRIIMGSMHTGLVETRNWLRVAEFYKERAQGGVGLIVTGGIAPNKEGGVFPDAGGLYTQDDLDGHQFVTQEVHNQGGKIVMQILHAGRYAYAPNCVAPSPIKSPISPFVPHELDEEGIEKQIIDIAKTAEKARSVGYDGVEIMGSEGYFLNQFLVTRTNQRTDQWGGSYQNRMRLPLEVVKRVYQAVGSDFLIIYRLSMIDLVPEGSSWNEVVELAKEIEKSGANLINTGIGWHESSVPTIATSVPKNAFAWVTKKLMGHVNSPIIASNRINSPEIAESLLAEGYADLISMARPFLADSHFVQKAASGQAKSIAPCIACNQACLDHTFTHKIPSCLVNPRACYETELYFEPTQFPKRIAIVGAGPAGLSSAITCAGRGHHIDLFEQASMIGGQLNLASMIPGKEEFKGLLDWYSHMIQDVGINLHLNHSISVAELAQYDEIIIATGVNPHIPTIPGVTHKIVINYQDLVSGKFNKEVNDFAIVGAGGIGFDVAEFLTHDKVSPTEDIFLWKKKWGVTDPAISRGGLSVSGPQPSPSKRNVFLMQRSRTRIGKKLGKTTGWIHRSSLKMNGVKMYSGVNYKEINREGILIQKENGTLHQIPAGVIVLCTGQVPNRTIATQLASKGIEFHLIGGAEKTEGLDAKIAIDQGTRLGAVM